MSHLIKTQELLPSANSTVQIQNLFDLKDKKKDENIYNLNQKLKQMTSVTAKLSNEKEIISQELDEQKE